MQSATDVFCLFVPFKFSQAPVPDSLHVSCPIRSLCFPNILREWLLLFASNKRREGGEQFPEVFLPGRRFISTNIAAGEVRWAPENGNAIDVLFIQIYIYSSSNDK